MNILIAIIIDSYDSSKERSREIFYRARIEYAAHLLARKQFLTPKECSDFHVATYVPQSVRQGLRVVYFLVIAGAMLAAEYGYFGSIYFLTLENKYDYRMIRSLVVVYVCVGSIFNAYILAVAVISLFRRYKRLTGYLLTEDHETASHGIVERIVHFLEVIVKLFHSLLGFNADLNNEKVVDIDISEEYLRASDDK